MYVRPNNSYVGLNNSSGNNSSGVYTKGLPKPQSQHSTLVRGEALGADDGVDDGAIHGSAG